MSFRLIASYLSLAALAGCAASAPGFSPGSAESQAVRAPAKATPAPITVDPNPLKFTTAGDLQQFVVDLPTFFGSFAAKVPKTCKSIKVVQKKLSGPSASFDVKSVKAGRCDVTISGGGRSIVETIYVTTTGGVIH